MRRQQQYGKSGPALPARLEKEIGHDPQLVEGVKKRGSMFAVSRRKVERKQARRQHKQQRHSGLILKSTKPSRSTAVKKSAPLKRAAPPEQPSVNKKKKRDSSADDRALSKAAETSRAPRPGPIRHDLLQAQGTEAMAAEEAYQQQLAKRLGLRNSAVNKREAEPDHSEGEHSSEDASLQEGGLAASSLDEGEAGGYGEDVHYLPKDNLYAPAEQTPGSSGVYVPPAARARQAETSLDAAVTRRVKGLLNRLAEVNLQGIASEATALMQQAGRRQVGDAITDELLQAAAKGPRASAAFCATAAAFVAGLAGTAHMADLGARFAEATAVQLEAAHHRADTLASRNLAVLLSHLALRKLLHISTLFSLLDHLCSRFQEEDVVLMHTVLTVAGFHLRSEDPITLKDFIVTVHAQAARADESMSTRTRLMLDLVLDIKNNRRRKGDEPAAAAEGTLGPAARAWLRSADVQAVQLQGLSWQRLAQPGKKGAWWLAGEQGPSAGVGQGAAMSQALAQAAAGAQGTDLLQLAAAQRFATDVQRAAFCCIMGSSDAAQATERLLRLPLKGAAERALVTVAVDCCLREKAWNPFYAHLLSRLAATGSGHRSSLRQCMADHLKRASSKAQNVVAEKGSVQPSMRHNHNLSNLVAFLLANKSLSIAVLQVAGMQHRSASSLQILGLIFWRLFQRLSTVEDATNIFAVVARQPSLHTLAALLLGFLTEDFREWVLKQKGVYVGDHTSQTGPVLERAGTVVRYLRSQLASVVLQ